jgi:Transmembrane protein
MAFYSINANVGAAFAGSTSPTASQVSAAKSSLTAALSLSIICLAVCFVGLFGGFTLMFDK